VTAGGGGRGDVRLAGGTINRMMSLLYAVRLRITCTPSTQPAVLPDQTAPSIREINTKRECRIYKHVSLQLFRGFKLGLHRLHVTANLHEAQTELTNFMKDKILHIVKYYGVK
jgi:hypothetical protein